MSSLIRSVGLFCGSAEGAEPEWMRAAAEFGNILAWSGVRLVYGGGAIGLMGVLADAAIAAGGTVHGVIPDFLARREVAHPALARLDVTATMHERKARLLALADAVVALPGGLGTFDELFETLTAGQLGLHRLAVGALDVDGFFGPMLAQLDRAVADRLLQPEHRDRLVVDTDPERLLSRLASAAIPDVAKSFDRI